MIRKAMLAVLFLGFFLHLSGSPRHTGSLEERVGALETQTALLAEFKQQQRDYNTEAERHLTTHVDARLADVESRLNSVYALGNAGVWLIGIMLSLYFYHDTQKRKDQQDQHKENKQLLQCLHDRVVDIEHAFGIEPKEESEA